MKETGEHRLYVGDVMHMRLRPFGHKFRYRVFTSFLDVDRLETAESRLFGINRKRRLFSFWEKDHGARDGSPLRPWVEALLATHGRPVPARIMLVSMPRLLGYAFNPLSIFFCYDEAGEMESIVYEVKNTFGDQIPYVVDASNANGAAATHEQTKEMFVSPFIEMDQTYRFTIRAPGDRLAIRIKQGDGTPGGDWLIATQNGVRRELSDKALRGLALTHPLAAFKVIAAIHWQALKLWLKGARFIRYPGEEQAIRRQPPLSPAE